MVDGRESGRGQEAGAGANATFRSFENDGKNDKDALFIQ